MANLKIDESNHPSVDQVIARRQQTVVLTDAEFPFGIESQSIHLIDDDWDLNTMGSCSSMFQGPLELATRSCSEEDSAAVAIGRDGDLIASASSASMLRHCEANGSTPKVTVVGRHRLWNEFRSKIMAYASRQDDGLVYAPLTHIDLGDIQTWNTHERANSIRRHISSNSSNILDIGAHWGYMCEVFELCGYDCTAVEWDSEEFAFMKTLRRSQRFNYKCQCSDIVDYALVNNYVDTVFALAVFHHFIKTHSGFLRLIQLLNVLEMNEMFFWAHNPDEAQMRNSYRNFAPDEFATFITEQSCLTTFECIGVIEYRKLYHLKR